MYGSEDTDLVVRYYDIAFGIHGEYEDTWYLNKVKQYGGPVLDLACGTGRMAMMIAKAGFNVMGLDKSEGMLNQFKRTLGQQPSEIRDRITIEEQDMKNFSLGRKFNTIMCCDAFFHNLTISDEIACLGCVAGHLTANGGFVFNLPNPNCEFIIKSAQSGGKTFERRGKYPLKETGEILVVEEAQDADPFEQIITTTLRFTIFDVDGHQNMLGLSSWKTRYLFRYEIIHLLYRCGLNIKSLVGDYQEGPVREDSQLIFESQLHNWKNTNRRMAPID
ncbi:MAG: class I SAM-dependent methyltransferase [Anaerolineales bacterium]